MGTDKEREIGERLVALLDDMKIGPLREELHRLGHLVKNNDDTASRAVANLDEQFRLTSNNARDAQLRTDAIANQYNAIRSRLDKLEARSCGDSGHNDRIHATEMAQALDRGELRALSGRVQAMCVRLDQLEAGRTGKAPIAFIEPSHAVRRHVPALEQAGPPASVHPDHLRTHYEVSADGGDTMAHAILTVTKERDEARWALKASQDDQAVRLESARHAAGRAQAEAEKLRGLLEAMRTERDDLEKARAVLQMRYEAQCEDQRHTVAERDDIKAQALTMGEELNKAVAAREALRESFDAATAQSEQHAAKWAEEHARVAELQAKLANRMRTASDQADQIAELRARLATKDENPSEFRALHDSVRFVLAKHGNAPVTRDGIMDVIGKAFDELHDVREQLRVADADRIPLRMDLDEARAAIKRMGPLCATAQRVANALEHIALGNTNEPQPAIAACTALIEASDTFERLCAEASALSDDDGFADAAANEGARIAAESRAEDDAWTAPADAADLLRGD